VFHLTDYRKILKAEYQSRRASNPAYSLRAFARDTGLSSPRLSEIFKRKQGLSLQAAKLVARRLRMSEAEVEYFSLLAAAEHGRGKLAREAARAKLGKLGFPHFTPMQLDAFKIVGDWRHLAIAELTAIKDFSSDPRWIARKLGITSEQARDGVERLLRVGIIRKKGKRLAMSKKAIAFPSDIPSQTVRGFHMQVLRQAGLAIAERPLLERDFSSLTLAFSKARLGEAKERIKAFRREFNQHFSGDVEADSVYLLNVQFFEPIGSES
jgi:uncharacterized protein (TIGR02147 family)